MSDVVDRAEAALSPGARMDAYYYSFRNTGLAVIDSILSAVATAGKAHHHTEEWGEAGTWDDKPTHESRIQSAADESATLVRELVAELKTAREEARQWKSLWQQNTETASVAIRERDTAQAELERLQQYLGEEKLICWLEKRIERQRREAEGV